MGDGGGGEDRRRAFGAKPEIGEFAERTFHHSFGRIDRAFDDDLGMGRHFQIDGLAPDHLHIFAEHAGGTIGGGAKTT